APGDARRARRRGVARALGGRLAPRAHGRATQDAASHPRRQELQHRPPLHPRLLARSLFPPAAPIAPRSAVNIAPASSTGIEPSAPATVAPLGSPPSRGCRGSSPSTVSTAAAACQAP